MSTSRCSRCCYSKQNVSLVLLVGSVVCNYVCVCKEVPENYFKNCTNNHICTRTIYNVFSKREREQFRK